MSTQTYPTSAAPHITIDACGGDLLLEGRPAAEVVFDYDESGSQLQRDGETFRGTLSGDGRIACPAKSSVTLHRIGGDLRVTDLNGTLAVETVGGDASLRGVGTVTLNVASGDMDARDVAGDLRIESVAGDLEVRRIGGRLVVGRVGGDLSARSFAGGMDIQQVAGDASLETEVTPDQTYRARAAGDLTVRVPPHSSARFTLSAGGEIKNRLGGEWTGDSHAATGVTGQGGAHFELSAGGDLMLLPLRGDAEFEFAVNVDAINSQIEAKMAQIEHEMEARMRDLNSQIERMAALGLEERLRHAGMETETPRAERSSERARRRAAEAAERARRQAERAAERARRRSERHGGTHAFRFHVDWGSPGRGPRPGSPPPPSGATDAERLTILKMLEEHKISADEAGRLLQALEG